MNFLITAMASLPTSWSSSMRRAEHACASTSGSRELSERASIHPRHRVQIPGQEHTKKTSKYRLMSTHVEGDPYFTRYRAPRKRGTLQENTKALADKSRVYFVGGLRHTSITTWTRLWLKPDNIQSASSLAPIQIPSRRTQTKKTIRVGPVLLKN